MKKTLDQVKLMLKLHELEQNGDGGDTAEALREVTEGLDPSLLKRYLKLKQKKGTAIAILRNRACSECNMLYPETHDVFRYKNFVHHCEFCGRLLLVN